MPADARPTPEPERSPDGIARDTPSVDSWGGETDWGLIRAASGEAAGLERERAWRRLVARYERPVRRLLGRHLRGDPSAEDATSDFFSDLFLQQILAKADPDQGRFRCYVQGVVRRYALQWRRAGRARPAEDVDDIDVGAESDPRAEREEEAIWATAVLEHALEALRATSPRDAEVLERTYGLNGVTRVDSARLARELGLTANALDVARTRARKRLRLAIVDELRPMVSRGEELDLELRLLEERLLEAHPGLVAIEA